MIYGLLRRLATRTGRSVFVKIGCVLLTSLTFISPSASAAGAGKEALSPKSADAVEAQPVEEVSSIDTAQEKATEMLLSSASWIDNFFNDKRYVEEENHSRGTLVLSTAYTENEQFEFRPSIDWRIRLPHLTDKLNLVFFATDNPDFEADKTPGTTNPITQNNKSRVFAGIQYFLRNTEKHNLSTTLGGSWDYLFAGLRFRHYQDFGPIQGRFVEQLRYYTDDGWENTAYVDIERKVSENWFLRTTAAVYWYERQDGLPHSLLLHLYEVLANDKAISYEWDNYFDTSPSYKMTDLQLRVRYRQRFYRDWLVLEVAPQVTFPEDHDREANLGIIFRLEADFGYLKGMGPHQNVFRF